MKNEESTSSKFVEVKDESRIAKAFKVASVDKVFLTFWFKNQNLKFDSTVIEYLPNTKKIHLQFPVTVNEVELLRNIQTQGTNDIFGSMRIGAENFFFKTQLTDVRTSMLIMNVPDSVYRLQRRMHLRIPFPRKLAPKLFMPDPTKPFQEDIILKEEQMLFFRVLDVSVGGLSIAVALTQRNLFSSNQILKQLLFKIRGREILTNGEVRYIMDTQSDQGKSMAKIGIKFIALKPAYEKVIVQFVLDESRALFSRMY